MSETMISLRRQIETTHDIQSVVSTMKALALVNIRHYQEAVDSLAAYRRTIDMGFQVVLRNRPHARFGALPKTQRAIIVAFGSDQGLVGQFNDRIASHLHRDISPPDGDAPHLICAVGMRLQPPLSDYGYPIEAVVRVPGSISGISPVVRDILLKVAAWRSAYGIDRLLLIYNRPTTRVTYATERLDLLPLDADWLNELRSRPWESRAIPTARMDFAELFSQLTQQYLFASIYAAMAGSLASENASRLASMENAEKDIEKRLDNLRQRYNLKRQDAITEELFDVIAGFELLNEDN